jgi:putative transposase
MIFHVLNRADGRTGIFDTEQDYRAFLQTIREALLVTPMRILSYNVLPNHWHFVLWPELDGQLPEFMHQATTTHVRRWREYRRSVDEGHLYQGPYKPFPVQRDEHFYIVCRYVERNALRAKLVERAEHWRWSSLWARSHPGCVGDCLPLSEWPLPMPTNWTELVNEPITEGELAAVRTSVRRGRPFGEEAWQLATADKLNLQHTLRSRGRPRTSRL